MRRLAPLVLVLGVVLLGSASTAAAGVDEVVRGLREQPLYVDPASAVQPDAGVVLDALEDAAVPTYIVVVPQADAAAQELGIDGLLLRIVERLDRSDAVVLVVTDGEELQVSGGIPGVDAVGALDRVLTARLEEPFTSQTLTGALVDFTEQVSAEAPQAAGVSRRTVGLAGLVAVAVLTAGWLYVRARRRVLDPAPLSGSQRAEEPPGRQGARAPDQGTVEP